MVYEDFSTYFPWGKRALHLNFSVNFMSCRFRIFLFGNKITKNNNLNYFIEKVVVSFQLQPSCCSVKIFCLSKLNSCKSPYFPEDCLAPESRVGHRTFWSWIFVKICSPSVVYGLPVFKNLPQMSCPTLPITLS